VCWREDAGRPESEQVGARRMFGCSAIGRPRIGVAIAQLGTPHGARSVSSEAEDYATHEHTGGAREGG
jgi:hypothetical protein